MDSSPFDYLFKLLMIGDSGVGKSCLLLRFTSGDFEDLPPTIGVDFKVKYVTMDGQKLKLAIWDTAGQERFRTLTSSYYRGAQGIIMVYDVTRRETFTDLSEVWAKEIDLYSTNQDCMKMLVGNKVDKEEDRVVSKKEGIDFAREYGCLFTECSAKTRTNVQQCFEELVLKILDTPSLVAEGSKGVIESYKDLAFSEYARVGRALALYEVGDREEAIAEMEDVSISLKGYPGMNVGLFIIKFSLFSDAVFFPGAEVHAALAAALYSDKHAALLAENQFTIATLLDPHFTDLSYVRDTKHWPPSLISSLHHFITLS
ncbi:hypothetical protein RYX36_033945 [Vicia faba]